MFVNIAIWIMDCDEQNYFYTNKKVLLINKVKKNMLMNFDYKNVYEHLN